MYEIVENEYSQFLQDMADGVMVFGRYVDESEYEDEYSHNDIDDAKNLFMEKVKEYLHKIYPGKYVVASSYCVFVMTSKEARERHISERTIELFTVR